MVRPPIVINIGWERMHAMKSQRLRTFRIAMVAFLAGLGVMLALPRPANASLTLWDAVIDFGQRNPDRVTIRGTLQGANPSSNPGDFSIQVIITDNRTGTVHDSGVFAATSVR
jgi:hypothetical protein